MLINYVDIFNLYLNTDYNLILVKHTFQNFSVQLNYKQFNILFIYIYYTAEFK